MRRYVHIYTPLYNLPRYLVVGGDEADKSDDDEEADDDALVWVVLELQRQQLAALMSQHLLKYLDSVLRESDGGCRSTVCRCNRFG